MLFHSHIVVIREWQLQRGVINPIYIWNQFFFISAMPTFITYIWSINLVMNDFSFLRFHHKKFTSKIKDKLISRKNNTKQGSQIWCLLYSYLVEFMFIIYLVKIIQSPLQVKVNTASKDRIFRKWDDLCVSSRYYNLLLVCWYFLYHMICNVPQRKM